MSEMEIDLIQSSEIDVNSLLIPGKIPGNSENETILTTFLQRKNSQIQQLKAQIEELATSEPAKIPGKIQEIDGIVEKNASLQLFK